MILLNFLLNVIFTTAIKADHVRNQHGRQEAGRTNCRDPRRQSETERAAGNFRERTFGKNIHLNVDNVAKITWYIY